MKSLGILKNKGCDRIFYMEEGVLTWTLGGLSSTFLSRCRGLTCVDPTGGFLPQDQQYPVPAGGRRAGRRVSFDPLWGFPLAGLPWPWCILDLRPLLLLRQLSLQGSLRVLVASPFSLPFIYRSGNSSTSLCLGTTLSFGFPFNTTHPCVNNPFINFPGRILF